MTDCTEPSSAKSHTAKNNDGTLYSVREDESVTEAVVRAVSAEKESHPAEIESLYSVIETDALNSLFAPRTTGDRRTANGTIAFRYSGCDIQVTDDGKVILKKGDSV